MVLLSVIIPAYNEGEHIAHNLGVVETILSNSGISHEIILVDDGSTDNTYFEGVRTANNSKKIKVVRKEHGGKGSALKHGFRFCSGKLVTFIDADLDLHPRQIPRFIRYMVENDADVVVGSKRHPLSRIDYPFHRKFLSRAYQLMVKLLFNLDVRDTQAGLKLFRHSVLKEVLPRILCKKYAFDLELLVNAAHRGFRIVEAPIELNWKRVSSRMKIRDGCRIMLDTMAVFYRLRIIKYYDRVDAWTS